MANTSEDGGDNDDFFCSCQWQMRGSAIFFFTNFITNTCIRRRKWRLWTCSSLERFTRHVRKVSSYLIKKILACIIPWVLFLWTSHTYARVSFTVKKKSFFGIGISSLVTFYLISFMNLNFFPFNSDFSLEIYFFFKKTTDVVRNVERLTGVGDGMFCKNIFCVRI